MEELTIDEQIAALEADAKILGEEADQLREERKQLQAKLSALITRKNAQAKVASLTDAEKSALGISVTVPVETLKMSAATND